MSAPHINASTLFAEIADKLYCEQSFPLEKSKPALNQIPKVIAEHLERGDRAEFRGFGSFTAKKFQARTGRNPQTGENIDVAARYRVVFKTGKGLSDRIARSAEAAAEQTALSASQRDDDAFNGCE